MGRVNATGRAANRTCGAIGALLGGLVAEMFGLTVALWMVVALFATSALIAARSQLRTARGPVADGH